LAKPFLSEFPDVTLQIGGLSEALQRATLALASTGTVTLECAWYRVPFVALYKTSWLTYQIGKRIVTVKYLAMPNLLAGREIAKEFVQGTATGENVAKAALELLENRARWEKARQDLGTVVESLGVPGAVDRAAAAIHGLLDRG
jgi:lipid-A-disaccharide synthase